MFNRISNRRIWISGLLLFLVLLPRGDAQADVGLPPSQPGSSLSPGDHETRVQMVSEQVQIIIPQKPPEAWMAQAQITADFQMLNRGEEDESIEVWFPFGEKSGDTKGWKVIQVMDFEVWVEGQKLDAAVNESDEWQIIWAHWPVTFPAGEEINIRVSYTITENLIGGGPYNFHGFFYILETGAGWEGVIEEALITVQAPYDLDELDDFLMGKAFHARPEGYTAAGREIRWRLTNLEPTASDNIEIYLLHQEIWMAITGAKEALQTNPEDWKASFQLANAVNAWILAQPTLISGGYIQTIPDLDLLRNYVALNYHQALDHSPPDLDYYFRALSFFDMYPELIESRDLQDYYFQAVGHFPDDQQLQEDYLQAIEEGRIGEGPPPSPTSLPTAAHTATAPPPTVTITAAGETETSNPLYFILGMSSCFFAILLLLFAVWRIRQLSTW